MQDYFGVAEITRNIEEIRTDTVIHFHDPENNAEQMLRKLQSVVNKANNLPKMRAVATALALALVDLKKSAQEWKEATAAK